MHAGVGGGLGRDGEALPLPQHGGRRVGHNVAADVDWVPLPGVVDGVVGQELGYVCGDGRVDVRGGQRDRLSNLVALQVRVDFQKYRVLLRSHQVY